MSLLRRQQLSSAVHLELNSMDEAKIMATEITGVILFVNGQPLAQNTYTGVSEDLLATTSVGDRLKLEIPQSGKKTYVVAEKSYDADASAVGIISLNVVSALPSS